MAAPSVMWAPSLSGRTPPSPSRLASSARLDSLQQQLVPGALPTAQVGFWVLHGSKLCQLASKPNIYSNQPFTRACMVYKHMHVACLRSILFIKTSSPSPLYYWRCPGSSIVFCRDQRGESPGFSVVAAAAVPDSMGAPVQVTSTGYMLCVRTDTGNLKCLLDNKQSTKASWRAVPIPSEVQGRVANVSVGLDHVCALTTDQAVHCWGSDGSIGRGGLDGLPLKSGGGGAWGAGFVPSALGPAVAVVAGYYHTCAITALRTVRCWTHSNWDQGIAKVPTDLGTVTAVDAGESRTCAATDSGAVRCWGRDNYTATFQYAVDLGRATSVSVGNEDVGGVLTAKGVLLFWWDHNVQLDGNSIWPTRVANGSVLALANGPGDNGMCVLGIARSLRCWRPYYDPMDDYNDFYDAGPWASISTGNKPLCAINMV